MAVSKKFKHLNRGMGFEERQHNFRGLRATLIDRLMNAKVDKTLPKKLVGYKRTDMTYDLCAASGGRKGLGSKIPMLAEWLKEPKFRKVNFDKENKIKWTV